MKKRTSQNFWPQINSVIDYFIKTAWSLVSKTGFNFFWVSNFWKRDISSASEKTFPGFFVPAELSQRGFLVHKKSIAPCQLVSWHSVEPRALTCPFRQSNAWSLLSLHPTHVHLWERLSVFQSWLLSRDSTDKGFVIWHFLRCFVQIVSLLSLNIWIRIVSTTNDLVDSITLIGRLNRH